MLNIKKTAAAVLALGSSAVFAGTMGPVCTPGNVTVPCERTAFDLGVEALYLKPMYSGDFEYVRSTSVTNDGVTTTNHVDNEQDWDWGYRLEASYHFSTGNDLTVNWLHFDNTTRKTWDGAGGEGAFTGHTSWEPSLDVVNIEMAQHADFGMMKNVRMHAGFQYADLESQIQARLLETSSTDARSEFSGFGPRAGLDMSYDWNNGFAIYGNTSGALLVGKSKSRVEEYTQDGDTRTLSSVNLGDKDVLVPALDAKVGATYTFAMAEGDVTLDAGWNFANWFNAQHQAGVGNEVSESNLAYQGVSLKLKYVGAM